LIYCWKTVHLMKLDLEEFEKLVSRALAEIPRVFMEKLENLEIIVEEEPSSEVLESLGLNQGELLFGLYQGVPRPDKSFFQVTLLPDRITLFRLPLLKACRTKKDIMDQIGKTVVHEIAHYFGFSEQEIRKLGY